jgi:GntR family transcriptional regulator
MPTMEAKTGMHEQLSTTCKENGPLYLQLASALKTTIQEKYQQGDLFHSEAQIEQQFKVSRITVRHALKILEREGYIFREAGKAPIVSRIKPVIDTGHRIGRLAEELRSMGLKPKVRHYDFEVVNAPYEDFRKNSIEFAWPTVFRFKHLVSIDTKPLSYAINYILTDPAVIHLTETDLQNRDFYDVLAADYDMTIINGEQCIGAVLADKPVADILSVAKGAPLLRLDCISFTKEGQKRVYALVHYDAALFQFRQLIQR